MQPIHILSVLTILLWSLAMATPGVGDDPAAVKEERNDDMLSEVDSDGSDEGSLSDGTAFTQSTRTTVKNKILKSKKTRAKHQFIKDCFACSANSDQWDELQEFHRRQNPKLNLPHIKQRWGRPRETDGSADGEQCYICRRTIRSKVMYSQLRASQMKVNLKADKEFEKLFAADRLGTVAILAHKGHDAKLSSKDLETVSECWAVEEVGEDTGRGGINMSEAKVDERYKNEEERTKLSVKEVRKSLVTGEIETVVRIFDEEEGIERFNLFQRRFGQKRTRMGDSETSSTADTDAFMLAVAQQMGPQNTKGFLTAADVKHMETESLSKSEKKQRGQADMRKLKTNEFDKSSSSAAPLLSVGVKADATKKKKAKPPPPPSSASASQSKAPSSSGSAMMSPLSLSGSRSLSLFVCC